MYEVMVNVVRFVAYAIVSGGDTTLSNPWLTQLPPEASNWVSLLGEFVVLVLGGGRLG